MKGNTTNDKKYPSAQPLYRSLDENLNDIRTTLGNSSDLVTRPFSIHKTSAAVHTWMGS
ncbi:hypothetical protein [Halobacillus aidingensis]|uniref:hypothetical protein n=1 Tax=Halobacillus aidingensis TaxID=240303 RepID=UPI003133CDF8